MNSPSIGKKNKLLASKTLCKSVLLAMIGVTAIAAPGAAPMTVNQLHEFLSVQFAAHKSDGEVARRLMRLDLSERLTAPTLANLENEFKLGPKTAQALDLLADTSAFLDPPANEESKLDPPDPATRESLLNQAINFAAVSLRQMPDFLAIRETHSFGQSVIGGSGPAVLPLRGEGEPDVMAEAASPAGALGDVAASVGARHSNLALTNLQLEGAFSQEITYRDGQEVSIGKAMDPGTSRAARQSATWLTSSGEFGPALEIVFLDASKGKLVWSHWESTPEGPAAIFRYAVPEEASHFEVGKCPAATSAHRPSGNTGEYCGRPGYHGTIAVDPSNGTVQRLTMVAELKSTDEITYAAVAVEYGSVMIGENTYQSPVRSVAITSIRSRLGGEPIVQLNEVRFSNYHRFGSTAHLITEPPSAKEPNALQQAAVLPNASPTITSPARETAAASDAGSVAQNPSTQAAVSSNASPAPPKPTTETSAVNQLWPVAQSGPQVPEPQNPNSGQTSSDSAAAAINQTESAEPSSPSEPVAPRPAVVLRSRTNLVLVDTVVTEHNRPVHGIDRDRFHVSEDEKPQTISAFDEHRLNADGPAVDKTVLPHLPPNVYSNMPLYPSGRAVNVLLLDALNTPAVDLQRMRSQMIDFLMHGGSNTSLAIFSLSSELRMVAGFTTDMTQLARELQSGKAAPKPINRPGTQSDSVGVDIDDLASGFNAFLENDIAAGLQQFERAQSASNAEQRARMTAVALRALADYLSAIPGRKNLVWFAGSFPPAPVSALAAARVAIYPVDARGMRMSSCNDATRTYTCEQMAGPLGLNPAPSGLAESVDQALGGNGFVDQSSRDQAAMHQIAAATGGREFVDANDLKVALADALDDGSSYYTLGYIPSNEGLDGKFRKIQVRVDGGNYQLIYKNGYYSDAPDKPSDHGGGSENSMKEAMLHGAPPSTQILFQVRVLPASDSSLKGTALPLSDSGDMTSKLQQPTQKYVVDITIDPHALLFEAAADGMREAQLQFALVSYNPDGHRVNGLSREFIPKIQPQQFDQAMSRDLDFRLTLDLPEGRNSLRIAVQDVSSGNTGSMEIPLTVAAN